jgi:hypothetical protein
MVAAFTSPPIAADSLGVRRGPGRVIRIDLETGGPTGYVDVPSPCGHAGGLAVGGDTPAATIEHFAQLADPP